MSCDETKHPLRIVLISKTGVGKSSLGNTMIANAGLVIGGCGASVTEATSSVRGTLRDLLGDRDVEVVDTPGIYDTTPGKDVQNIADMVKKLKGKNVDLFCLVFNAEDPRLTPVDVALYSLFNQIFVGRDRSWMENCCIVFTRWQTGAKADSEREAERKSVKDIEKGMLDAMQKETGYHGEIPIFYVDNLVWRRKKSSGNYLRSREQQAAVMENLTYLRYFAEGRQPFNCVDIKEAMTLLDSLKHEQQNMKKQNLQLRERHRAQKARNEREVRDLTLKFEDSKSEQRQVISQLESRKAGLRSELNCLQSQIQTQNASNRRRDQLPLIFVVLCLAQMINTPAGRWRMHM